MVKWNREKTTQEKKPENSSSLLERFNSNKRGISLLVPWLSRILTKHNSNWNSISLIACMDEIFGTLLPATFEVDTCGRAQIEKREENQKQMKFKTTRGASWKDKSWSQQQTLSVCGICKTNKFNRSEENIKFQFLVEKNLSNETLTLSMQREMALFFGLEERRVGLFNQIELSRLNNVNNERRGGMMMDD